MGTQARDVVARSLNIHARRDAAEGICEVGWCDCGDIGAVDSDGALQLHQADAALAALSEAGFVVVPTEGEGDVVESDRGYVVVREMGDRFCVRVQNVAGGSGVVFITREEVGELARIAFRSALTPGGETP